MLTGHVLDLAEAQVGENKRSQRAASRASCPNHSTERCWPTPSFRTLSARPCPFQRSAPRSATAATRSRSLTFRHADEPMGAQRMNHPAEEAFPRRDGQPQSSVTWLALRCWEKMRRIRPASTGQSRDAVHQFIQIKWFSKERRYTERFVPRG